MSDRGITIEEVPQGGPQVRPEWDTASGLSPYAQDQALPSTGNALWEGARDIGEGLWRWAKVPGEVWEGKHDIRDIAPRPNELQTGIALPFAAQMAGMGGWMPAPAGSLRAFSAYHGTGAAPFEQFSNKFLLSGEGAAAYAAGHYVAGAEEIGKFYQSTVGRKAPNYVGKEPHDATNPMHIAAEMADTYGDRTLAAEAARSLTKPIPGGRAGELEANYKKAYDILASDKELPVYTKKGGSLINVHVKPDEHEMLPWDLKFSEMTPEMQGKLRSLDLDPKDIARRTKDAWDRSGAYAVPYIEHDLTGGELYKHLTNRHPSYKVGMSRKEYYALQQKASQALDDAGIPGTRFLDANSRNVKPTLAYTGDVKDLPQTLDVADFDHFHDFDHMMDAHLSTLGAAKKGLAGSPKFSSDSRYFNSVVNQTRDTIAFLENNKDKFIMKEPIRNHNYVVFDPKNMDITAWNGRKLEFVEGNPFEAR